MHSNDPHVDQQPEETEEDRFGDRFIEPRDALERVMHEDDFPNVPFELLEIRCTAAGEVNWRITEARSDEPYGGYIAPPE